jgi:hypothetical protein
MTDALLSPDLRVEFGADRRTVYAVNGISFEIQNGETPVCRRALEKRDVSHPGSAGQGGSSPVRRIRGSDLLQMSGTLKIRGRDDLPGSDESLNPVHTVGA